MRAKVEDDERDKRDLRFSFVAVSLIKLKFLKCFLFLFVDCSWGALNSLYAFSLQQSKIAAISVEDRCI